ncbi:Glycine-rich domain-containing protein 1 [Psilocybe cubensis]|uniref:Uncharacterized protein n=2 Tax=Psilocybe cubensis TaxID=181762 RepID=A0A8H8CLQ3_PSICU|nr:Glycine-rich domain-containing protein 1 [Psilocybe cubensis]KAH9483132.1 Glycine-rich domain-containing protein 1 [Psilocybe cubensis]
MSDVALPPAYKVSSPDDSTVTVGNVDKSLPKYNVPSTFSIGNAVTEPLVGLREIKGHLIILGAFAELKKKVESVDTSNALYSPVNEDQKWAWFVGLAVERFDVWCRALTRDTEKDVKPVVLPPLDVIMVWHSYMLNPRWYAEDCMRIDACKNLKSMEPAFCELLLDPSPILSEAPSKSRLDNWKYLTGLGFNLLDEMANMKTKSILCPMCNTALDVDYINKEGTGYLQQKFSAVCVKDGCSFGEINKEKLALGKLARDLAMKTSDAPGDHLPGTFFTASSADVKKGQKIKKILHWEIVHASNKTPAEANYTYGSHDLYLAIMSFSKYSLSPMREQMGLPYQPRLVSRIMSAYNDEKIYSVELVGAVLRQGSFVNKMHGLGWTKSGFFDEPGDELVLQHGLARYHAFLDLMSSSPVSFFVPTLDIDLIWHTHQLQPEKYEKDGKQYLAKFIDHDDKVEGIRLSSAFDITCRAWKERFNVTYTHCGCPVPGDTIGKRLSRMIGMYSQPTTTPHSHLFPITRLDVLAATHPSDHNTVRFIAKNKREHKVALRKYESLKKKKEKEHKLQSVKNESSDIPTANRRDEKAISDDSVDGESKFRNYAAHDMIPFLVPVPMFYFGGELPSGEACVATGGLAGFIAGGGAEVVAGVIVVEGDVAEAEDVEEDAEGVEKKLGVFSLVQDCMKLLIN